MKAGRGRLEARHCGSPETTRRGGHMRKTILSGTLLVLMSAVLGATVFREQVAQAAQAILPVRVTNTAADPVQVSGKVAIDGAVEVTAAAADQPYQETVHFNQSAATCTNFVCEATFAAVPAGKRLVVTYLSATYGLSPGGTLATVELGINGSFNRPSIVLPAERSGFDSYVASGPVTFYVDAGNKPTLDRQGQFVQPASLTASASIVGYLPPAS